MTEEDRLFNRFEQKYAEMFRDPQKQADCAFLVSRESFDHAADSRENTFYPLNGLMQAAYFANVQCDVVSEDENTEAFLRQKCIVSVGTALVTEYLADKLLSFVEKGGRLLIYGVFAEINPPEKVKQILRHPNARRFSWDFQEEAYQASLWCMRLFCRAVSKSAPPLVADFLRHGPGKRLRAQLPEVPQIEKITIGFHADLFVQKNDAKRMTLHVLDLRELLVPEGTMVSHV